MLYMYIYIYIYTYAVYSRSDGTDEDRVTPNFPAKTIPAKIR